MAKVHSGITNDGDPEVVLKPQKEPIEDVFSSTLGSGGFEEKGRTSRRRRQAVSSIQPLEEESVVGDTNRGDGFPVMRFRE